MSERLAVNSLNPGRSLRHYKQFLSRILAAGCVLLLISCASSPEEPEEAPPLQNPEPVLPAISGAELQDLLESAAAAISRDHLTYPEEGSAYAIYNDILQRMPGQADAERGLENIVEKYVELAVGAAQRNQFATARSMLARGRIVLPNHPSIEPTERQIRLLSEAQRTRIQLSQQIVAGSVDGLKTALGDIARVPDGARCRYHIWARNDQQGRHIYQVLTGDAGMRLQAQIEVRSPAGVERVCFDE